MEEIKMSHSSKILAAFLFILIASASLQSQNDVEIRLKQPPPQQLGVGDMWNLELNNTSGKDMKIYLTGTATEEKDGLIIEGKSKVFTLKPGRSNYKYNDFSGAEVKYNNGKYKEIILRTGNAPEGSYTICVTAFDEGGTEVGRENCIMQTVTQLGSITLLTPGDGGEIDHEQPILFSWTPLPKAEVYTLKIVEIKGDQSPEVAMKQNRAILEVNDIRTTTTHVAPSQVKVIMMGMKCAWQVTSGDVQSEVGSFKLAWDSDTDIGQRILFPDDIPYVLDAKVNSKIHGRELEQNITLHTFDKDLKADDKIYLLEPLWAGATSRDQKAFEKLNTNKIDAYYGILESPEGELYAMPILVLFDPDPNVRLAEACNKCPTNYENKRGCSMGGSFCFCLLSADSISKPKPINFTIGNGGSGSEVIKVFYPALLENMGDVIVAFECLIPSKQVMFSELLQRGYKKMISCCTKTDRRCCHVLEKSGISNY
jgi:hypothetical protein